MIRNLIFDFGNVLLKSDFPYLVNHIIKDEKIKSQFTDLVFDKKFTQQLDLGFHPSSELFKQLSEQNPQLEPYIREFKRHWMEHLLGEMPGMHQLLSKYKQRGYHLFGLSNWSDMIYPVIETYPIFKLLEGRVISSEEHQIKPNPTIYHTLLTRYNLIPSQSIFIDDKEENVITAQELGMHGIVFKSSIDLEVFLRNTISHL